MCRMRAVVVEIENGHHRNILLVEGTSSTGALDPDTCLQTAEESAVAFVAASAAASEELQKYSAEKAGSH